MTPHCRIHNTALAAALATLGVTLDPTEPYSRLIDTESGREQLTFLFRDASETDPKRRTEEIVTAWTHRARFEADFPTHPLVYMRAVHDARTWLLKVVGGPEIPPVRDFRGDRFQTALLAEAALLKAAGFPLLLFTGRAFAFPAAWKGVHSAQIIAESQRPTGAAPSQWQARFLVNLSEFLHVAKGTPTLATREDNKVLLLSADASESQRDTWLQRLHE